MSALERLRQMLIRYEMHQVPAAAVPTWHVDADGVQLQISVVPEPPHTRVRFEVALPGWRCDLLIMAAEHVLVSPPRLVSGDAAFDAKVVVCDRDAHVLGCFDAPTRALVAGLTASGGFVSGGAMVYSAPVEAPDLDRTLTAMLAIGKRLGLSEEATSRALEDIARDDPDAGVHSRHSRSGGRDALGDAEANAGRSDAERHYLLKRFDDWALPPAMRLDAAERLMEAFPLARLDVAFRAAPAELVAPLVDRLCAAIERRPVPDDATAELIVHFARQIGGDVSRLEGLLRSFVLLARAGLEPLPTYIGWLSGLVASDSESFLKLATRGLCALGGKQAFEALGRVQSRVIPLLPKLAHEHPEIGAAVLLHFFPRINPLDEKRQIAYVQAIVATGDSRVEAELAGLIETRTYDLQLELITALGAIGTLAIIPTLKPYSEGWLRDGSIKEAARLALAAIRRRGNLVSLPGALSIADHVSGALALDDEEADD